MPKSAHPRTEEILARIANGERASDIARETGIPQTTIRSWKSQVRPTTHAPPIAEVERMELAALRSGHPALKVEGYEDDPFPPAEMWAKFEAANAKRIERALKSKIFKVSMPELTKPIGLSFVSDQHISGDNLIDFKRLREDAEFIAKTPNMFALLGGDGIDNHIKHRAAMLSARTQPDDQLKLYDYYLQIFAHKIAVVISGNHDHWTNQFAGIDMVKRLAEQNKLAYSSHSAHVEWKVGSVTYRIQIAHQYRFNSSMNLTHTVKQMLNFGDHDFDVGCVCHHHEHAMESFVRRGLTRIGIRPGAYQITSDYSAQYGYPITSPTCPTVVVFPNSRKMVGFDDARDAATYMRGL